MQKLNNYCTITQSHLLFGETFIGELAKGSHDLQRRKARYYKRKTKKNSQRFEDASSQKGLGARYFHWLSCWIGSFQEQFWGSQETRQSVVEHYPDPISTNVEVELSRVWEQLVCQVYRPKGSDGQSLAIYHLILNMVLRSLHTNLHVFPTLASQTPTLIEIRCWGFWPPRKQGWCKRCYCI